MDLVAMPQVIADAPGIGAIVVRDDGVKHTFGIARGVDKPVLADKPMRSQPPRRAASLLIAATVLAATPVSKTQAEYVEPRASVRLAQATTSDPAASQGAIEQEQHRADTLVRGLAGARRDIESVLTLLSKAREESARIKASENEAAETDQLKQGAKGEPAELGKLLQQERERAGQLEQTLAAARRDVETQIALAAKAAEEAARDKQVAESTAVDLRKSLQQERDRTEALAREV